MSSVPAVPARAAPPVGHLPALDGLRGIAVLLVLWYHLPDALTPGIGLAIKRAVMPGALGVDVFFVLSGFLITRILLADKARGMPLRNFLIRRFLRIFPIYYLTIAVVAIFAPGPDLVFSALYLSNFYWPFHLDMRPLRHTWSLAVEEHFYLLWPLLVYRVSWVGARRAAGWIIGFAVACGIVFWAVEGTLPGRQLLYMSTFTRGGSLALGALFAFRELEIRGAGRAWHRHIAVLAAVAVSGAALHFAVSGAGKMFAILLFHAAISGIAVLAILRFHDGDRRLGAVLTRGFLPFAGRISYGLYMYHFPVYWAFGMLAESPVPSPPWTHSLMGLGCTFALALSSFYGLERPVLRFKERFRARPSAA